LFLRLANATTATPNGPVTTPQAKAVLGENTLWERTSTANPPILNAKAMTPSVMRSKPSPITYRPPADPGTAGSVAMPGSGSVGGVSPGTSTDGSGIT
jgi:hypothetical protein